MSYPQLPLALRLPLARRFDTLVGDGNEAVLAQAQQAAAGGCAGVVYLCGPEGVGKTHVLLAACAEAERLSRRAQYVSLASWSARTRVSHPPPTAGVAGETCGLDGDVVAALAALDLVCLDDLDAVIGQAEVEAGLFALINACGDARVPLWIAARAALPDLPNGLPDLRSRLAQGLRLRLVPLPEHARRRAVRLRAEQLGLGIDEAAIEFLFRRYPRDLTAMMGLLEQLDHASLAAKRRVTVPFLRETLDL